jgi:hypothetical protein
MAQGSSRPLCRPASRRPSSCRVRCPAASPLVAARLLPHPRGAECARARWRGRDAPRGGGGGGGAQIGGSDVRPAAGLLACCAAVLRGEAPARHGGGDRLARSGVSRRGYWGTCGAPVRHARSAAQEARFDGRKRPLRPPTTGSQPWLPASRPPAVAETTHGCSRGPWSSMLHSKSSPSAMHWHPIRGCSVGACYGLMRLVLEGGRGQRSRDSSWEDPSSRPGGAMG